MTIYHLLGLLLAFVVFVLVFRRRWLVLLIGFLLTGIGGYLAVLFFGLLPDYSTGYRTGIVQKYSVKGVIFKSDEVTMVLPIEGLVMTEGQINIFYVTCWPKKTPEACQALRDAIPSRKKILVEYGQWLRKPVYQDSLYTVRSAVLADRAGDSQKMLEEAPIENGAEENLDDASVENRAVGESQNTQEQGAQ